jgi:hypothetical protein
VEDLFAAASSMLEGDDEADGDLSPPAMLAAQ